MQRLDEEQLSMVLEFVGEPDSDDPPGAVREAFRTMYRLLCASKHLHEWWEWWYDNKMEIFFHH